MTGGGSVGGYGDGNGEIVERDAGLGECVF